MAGDPTTTTSELEEININRPNDNPPDETDDHEPHDEDEEHLLGSHDEQNTKNDQFCDSNCITTVSAIVFVTLIIVGIFLGVYLYQKKLEDEKHTITNQCVSDRYLILISMDGFQSGYLTNETWKTQYNVSTPTIDEMIKQGSYIKNVEPVYPSQTFPNHMSIVTGLYPGYHGIVANSFYDSVYNEWFSKGLSDVNGEWYRGEAIWQTMKNKQNTKKFNKFNIKKSGTTMWVGSEHNISGKGYPDNYMSYNASYSFDERIDRTINLLSTKEYRLLVLYFEQPDWNGHEFGPNSVEVATSVMEMDNVMNRLITKIKNLDGFWDNTDIMLMSDHGMKEVNNDTILIENTTEFDLVNDKDNFIVANNKNNVFITLTENSTVTIAETIDYITNNTWPDDVYDVYTKDNIPFEYKESYNDRIADVMIVAHNGYMFEYSNQDISEQRWLIEKGSHGWDPNLSEMQGIFIGRGPSFKKNYVKESAKNIHFYELMCQVLCGLIPSSNNGSLNEIKDILEVSYDIY